MSNDFTKCADFRCPSKSSCWRFMAPASAEQEFADYGSIRGRYYRCNDYINGELARRQWRASQESGRSKTESWSKESAEKV